MDDANFPGYGHTREICSWDAICTDSVLKQQKRSE